jgi:hypothetical protein
MDISPCKCRCAYQVHLQIFIKDTRNAGPMRQTVQLHNIAGVLHNTLHDRHITDEIERQVRQTHRVTDTTQQPKEDKLQVVVRFLCRRCPIHLFLHMETYIKRLQI